MNFFTKDKKTAFEAVSYAQFIAFAPILFQASKALRDFGILEIISQNTESGLTLEEIYPKVNLSEYGARVLLEAGLGIGLVIKKENKYAIIRIEDNGIGITKEVIDHWFEPFFRGE